MVKWVSKNPTGALVLDDGTIFKGFGFGAIGKSSGEVCFNTAISGYQEIMTDPSYCSQIITFTFPHIGNVGLNSDDNEGSDKPHISGAIFRSLITDPSNWRSEVDLDKWIVSDRFKTGKGPYNVEITPNGKYLVATLKGEGSTAIWDLDDKSLSNVVKNSTNVSHGVAISSDNKYAFISVEGIGGEPGKVDIIDLNKFKLVSTVNVGKQAGGIAFWKISD